MHPDISKSSNTTKNEASLDSLQEKLQMISDRSLHDLSFFLSLTSKEQLFVLDTVVKSLDDLVVDQRKAFLQCSAKFLHRSDIDVFKGFSDKVLNVVRSFVHPNLKSLHEIRFLVLPLRGCLQIILASTCALTALHSVFMQLCVNLDMFDVALPLVSIPVYDISLYLLPTALEYLSYHYFSGLVLAAFKQFEKAIASFDLAIGAVSVQISAIQIAAYKKRALVDIILNGSDCTPIPKLISPVVLKNLEVSSGPYFQIEAAASGGFRSLEAFFALHQKQLQIDGNVGLAKQALAALCKKQIARLAESFMTLSLQDIAKVAGLDSVISVEATILSMIDDGSINATIDQARQMLTFYEDSETFSNQESLAKLLCQLRNISAAHDRILAKNRLVANDSQYLKKTLEGTLKAESGVHSTEEAISHLSEMQQLFG